MKKVILPLAAMLIAGSSMSATANDFIGYVGVSGGRSEVDVGDNDFDKGKSYDIYGGYRFHPNFAIEASYTDLGTATDELVGVIDLEVDGVNLSLVGILPVSENIELFAKVGMYYWDAKLDADQFGNVSTDGEDISYSGGVFFALTPTIGLTLDYREYDIEDIDVSNASIGLRMDF